MAYDKQREIILAIAEDRILAHEVLFRHRHDSVTPPFHEEIIRDWHSPAAAICWIAFRGGAKSTRAEEGTIIQACFREFQNCIIFGSSFDRAAQRLHAIRREFEKNEAIHQIFGQLRGQPWGDDKIELSNGVVIQAMGRGQALRGTKEEIKRPDLIIFDDIEDKESVRTPEAREKIQSWALSEAIPAADPNARIRMLANDLDPECLANRLKHADSGFIHRVYPWEYIDSNGVRQPTWPNRFPLDYIDRERKRFYSLGRARDYNCEFMCRSEAPEDKPFRTEQFRIELRSRIWEPVYQCFDPARTVRSSSADTGYACWSWVGNRLIVWDAWGRKLMPDEIISAMFEEAIAYNPIAVGVDEVGLNEFVLQPLRQEQVRRGLVLPVKPLSPPKAKTDRIRALQPFFNAREVWFAKPLPELQNQLLAFPTGKRDIVDALAYALVMRNGAPIYDNFTERHVDAELKPESGSMWLAVNATPAVTTAVLLQLVGSAIHILNDWVREGEPAALLPDIVRAANLEAGRTVRLVTAPVQFDRYQNAGIAQCARTMHVEVRRGTDAGTGRLELRAMLDRDWRGKPSFRIAPAARWTLNALAGGYAQALDKKGVLSAHPEEGVYRVLMEGLEAFAGLLRLGSPDGDGDDRSYAYTPGGQRYQTALAPRR